MRRLLAVVALLLIASPVFAQRSLYQALTVDNTARSIAAATTAGMDTCVLKLETAEIRWRNDGTAPTSTVGTPIGVGTTITLNVIDTLQAQFIRTGGSSGVLHVNCFPAAADVSVTATGQAAAGTLQESDDASIAAAQTADVAIGLTMAFDGTVWRRLTFGTAGTASTQVLTVQGIASMTPLLVSPATGSFAADVTYGTSTYTEATSTGPMAGGVRNDTPDSLANTTNEAAPLGLTASGALWTATIDPCSYKAKTYYVLNTASAATVEIANAVAGEFWHICSVNLVAAAAQTIAIAADDTDGCGSLTAGLHGGVTAAEGWSFAANGGIALGNGNATVMKSATANHYLCFITGQAARIVGTIAYVSAP